MVTQKTLSPEATKLDFFKKGYSTIEYPERLKNIVFAAIEAWQKFCEQPAEIKERIPFMNGKGYENKDKNQNPEFLDHKENFEITCNYDFPLHLKPTPAETRLFLVTSKLFNELMPISEKITEMLQEITGHGFTRFGNNKINLKLRLLHYYPQDEPVLAHFHLDKGGHTLHLYDSVKGLEAFWNNEWRHLEFTENEIAFFPGLLAQHFSQCQVKALCHRVVSSEESKKYGRYSLVVFCDYPEHPYRYDKERFKSTQKAFIPGENYAMSVLEFNKLFTFRY